MAEVEEKIIRQGLIERTVFSCAKKYSHGKGELILTKERLSIKFQGLPLKTYPFSNIYLKTCDNSTLEIGNMRYNRLLFKFIIEKATEWEKSYNEIWSEILKKCHRDFIYSQLHFDEEIRNLLDMPKVTLQNLLIEILKERMQLDTKNMKFTLEIQGFLRKTKNRKIRAFLAVHSYTAAYEWVKKLLYKIHKAKYGKAPKDDAELMSFLDDYPSIKRLMDTSKWGMKSNQIRNCVAHQRFYFDYRSSELVFCLNKEVRVWLKDIEIIIFPMANLYSSIIRSLVAFAGKE